MDVEQASSAIDALIERRARQAEDDRRTEMAWKESVRVYHARLREENRAMWCEYFKTIARSLRSRAAEYDERRRRLEEDHEPKGETT